MTNNKGNHFKSEKAFSKKFVESVENSIPNKNGFDYGVIVREMESDRGRADIIYAFVDTVTNNLANLRKYGRVLKQPTKAKIISQLSKARYCPLESLAQATGYTQKTVKTHLHELAKAGIVKANITRGYKLEKSFNLPETEVWAFELKLDNWKRALYQALRYRGFSHSVTVVMPKEGISVAKRNLAMFKKMNVGLAEISNEGKMVFVKKPRRGKPTSDSNYLRSLGYIFSKFHRSDSSSISKIG